MKDIKEIRGLSPEERVRKLKEIEERKRKEIEEAESLRKASEIEIIEGVDEKARLPLEQLRAVNLDNLLTKEEKDIYSMKRFVSAGQQEEGQEEQPQQESLEEISGAAEEQSEDAKKQALRQYQINLSQEPTGDIYSMAVRMYQEAGGPGDVSREDFYAALNMSYAIKEKEEAMKRGEYSSSEEMQRKANAVRSMVEEIINWYRGY